MNNKITIYSNNTKDKLHRALLVYLERFAIPYEVVSLNDTIDRPLMEKIMRYYNAGFDAILNYKWRSSRAQDCIGLRTLLNNDPTFNQLLDYCVTNPKVLRNNIMWIPHKKRIMVGFTEQNRDELLKIYVTSKFKQSNRKSILAKAIEIGLANEEEENNGEVFL